MKLEEQWNIFYQNLTTRKRQPAKPSTLISYNSHYRNWIGPNLGNLELSLVENGVMKKFVSKLAEANLSPASINSITQLVKGILSSAVDENGNCTQTRKWNSQWIDAPIVDPKTQKAPVISATEVSEAILKAPSQYGPLFALLGGTGARISEALAIKTGPQAVSSYWDVGQSKIVIRRALYRGLEQTTKTPAGTRETDIPRSLNDYLKTQIQSDGFLFPFRMRTVYDVAEKLNIPGLHSFRRYRISHLENMGVPGGLARFWTGHSSRDVHENYIKLDKNLEARREWCEKAGLGFSLP